MYDCTALHECGTRAVTKTEAVSKFHDDEVRYDVKSLHGTVDISKAEA